MTTQTEKQTHTPGDWFRDQGGYIYGPMVNNEPAPVICCIQKTANKADIPLLLAAPELLRACKAIVGNDNPPAGEPGHIDLAEAIALARAAIADAEGLA